jgi:ABC-type nickel/cobalt efflux system permease component RcnA
MLPARAAPVARDSLAWLFQRGTQGGWWLWLALVGSALLGAGHALAPGHGKTLVAAYLVGARGTIRHALFLGGVVTITHVASVFALGAVALWLSAYVVPARLFSWLGLASGAGVVLLGLVMLRERVQRFYAAPTDEPREEVPPKENPQTTPYAATERETSHMPASPLVSQKEPSTGASLSPLAPQKETDTEDSSFSLVSQKETAAPPTKATNPGSALNVASVSALSPLSQKETSAGASLSPPMSQKETARASNTSPPEALRVGQLIAIGLAGGAVPCPSALVVLLAAVSAGEIPFGMSLIVAFSLGLALVLVALGILAVRARDWLALFSSRGRSWRALPVGSALLIVSLGTAIAINAAREAHLL